jgi:hypothetical protein
MLHRLTDPDWAPSRLDDLRSESAELETLMARIRARIEGRRGPSDLHPGPSATADLASAQPDGAADAQGDFNRSVLHAFELLAEHLVEVQDRLDQIEEQVTHLSEATRSSQQPAGGLALVPRSADDVSTSPAERVTPAGRRRRSPAHDLLARCRAIVNRRRR